MGDWPPQLPPSGYPPTPPPGGYPPAPPPGGGYPPAPPPGGGYAPPPPSPAAGGPLRPMTVGDVLDGMFRLVVRNLRTIGLTLPVVAIPISLLVAGMQRESMQGLGFFELLTNPAAAQATAQASPSPMFFLLYAASLVLGFVATPLMVGVVVAVAYQWLVLSRRPTPREVWRLVLPRWLALIGSSLLVGVLIFAMFVPGGVLIAGGVLADNNAALFIVGGLLIFVGFFAAIAVWAVTLLAPVGVVVERLGPWTSINRSFELVRRRFWPFFGIMVLAYLIGGLASGILSGPLTWAGVFISGVGGLTLLFTGTLLSQLIQTPLLASALTLEYVDLRVRTEGLDLQLMLDPTDRGDWSS